MKTKKIIILLALSLIMVILTGCSKKYYFPEYLNIFTNTNSERFVQDAKSSQVFSDCKDIYADNQGNVVFVLTNKQRENILNRHEDAIEFYKLNYAQYGVEVQYNDNYTSVLIYCSSEDFRNEITVDGVELAMEGAIMYQVFTGKSLDEQHVTATVKDIDTDEVIYEDSLSEEIVKNKNLKAYIVPRLFAELNGYLYEYSDENVSEYLYEGKYTAEIFLQDVIDDKYFDGMYEYIYIDEHDNITFMMTDEQHQRMYESINNDFSNHLKYYEELGCSVSYSYDFKELYIECPTDIYKDEFKKIEMHNLLPLDLGLLQTFMGVQPDEMEVMLTITDSDTDETLYQNEIQHIIFNYAENGISIGHNNEYTSILIYCNSKDFGKEITINEIKITMVKAIMYQGFSGKSIDEQHVTATVKDIDTDEVIYEDSLSEETVKDKQLESYTMTNKFVKIFGELYEEEFTADKFIHYIKENKGFENMYEYIYGDENDNVIFMMTEAQHQSMYDFINKVFNSHLEYYEGLGCSVSYSDDFKELQIECPKDMYKKMHIREEMHILLPLDLGMLQTLMGVQPDELEVMLTITDSETGEILYQREIK